jgi:hypothetical protein
MRGLFVPFVSSDRVSSETLLLLLSKDSVFARGHSWNDNDLDALVSRGCSRCGSREYREHGLLAWRAREGKPLPLEPERGCQGLVMFEGWRRHRRLEQILLDEVVKASRDFYFDEDEGDVDDGNPFSGFGVTIERAKNAPEHSWRIVLGSMQMFGLYSPVPVPGAVYHVATVPSLEGSWDLPKETAYLVALGRIAEAMGLGSFLLEGE